eukprot:gnl/Dysnectes_brevis/4034_a5269_1193.p1 GENE.gnl/Dysnectes_brevis/4034_a5269_1193~~gnl/Dysnectes_brevis/4034_a5269_1193.p1  ORF type:complete len:185 (-),score=11.80 gnl/Dysnectes_brevis/4034_a5269_1193:39-593(-)
MTSSVGSLVLGVVGPPCVGKSAIADYFTELSETPSADYIPTIGMRILETERSMHQDPSQPKNIVGVQVWDISGSSDYDETYPRLKRQFDCIVIVLSDRDSSIAKTMRHYFDLAVDHERITTNQVVAFVHKKGRSPDTGDIYIKDQELSQIPIFPTSLDSSPDTIPPILDALLKRALDKKSDIIL